MSVSIVRGRGKGVVLGGAFFVSAAWVLHSQAGSLPFRGDLTIDGEPVITVLHKDAIPAIDRPQFLSVREADRYMQDDEPILGVRRGKIARAYSLWQLNHHEIVNDTVGDLPLAITW